MNEPDLNHFSGTCIPRLPSQLLLVLCSLLTSLMLASAAFGFTDQNADLRSHAQERRERAQAYPGGGALRVAVAPAQVQAQGQAPATPSLNRQSQEKAKVQRHREGRAEEPQAAELRRTSEAAR